MSTSLLISLSNDQLNMLLAGADRVPHESHTRFLDNFSDLLLNQLSTTGEIVDADVERAVASTLRRIGVPVERAA
jgi:hypothetical protein